MGEFIGCGRPCYLERHCVPLTPDDLAANELMEYDPARGAKAAGGEWFDVQQSRYVSMPSTLTVNNTETYEAACIAGLGIIQVPLMGMRHLPQAKVLLEILPDHLPAPMPISILYQNRRQVPTRVRVFMDWLAELISRHAMEP